MTLKQLIQSNQWLNIKTTLFEIFPEEVRSINAYETVFENLRSIEPVDSEFEIILENEYDTETGEFDYVHLHGKTTNPESKDYRSRFAIYFDPWAEWLGMTINAETLEMFSEIEIVSHCLFEMTFEGFDEVTIKKSADKLNKVSDDFKKITPEEREQNVISTKEFLNSLKEE
jgi:hypothetical protein